MMEINYNDIYAPITAEEMANIPESMKSAPRWICWGSDKIPVSVASGRDGKHYGIDYANAANWGTFAAAASRIGEECYTAKTDEHFHIVGIGFVVGDGWFCVDMDGGQKHKNRENVPQAALDDALHSMQVYAEKSVSGCGYHLFGRCGFSTTEAENNEPHRDKDGEPVPNSYEVEFFTRRKFIAITGRKVPSSADTATDCNAAALDFYTRYILNDWKRDEKKREAERARIAAAMPVNVGDAEEMFRLNYPEILAASDSSNFKRGGRGVELKSGEYSWIAALKAMQAVGIPEADIMNWCRRGSNFRSEKDVYKVLHEGGNGSTQGLASIVQDAKEHGWKPDPEKLTGEYKTNYEQAQQKRQERAARHRENVTAALSAVGLETEYSDSMTVTYDWNGSVKSIVNTATGETLYTAEYYLDVETGEILRKAPDTGADPAANAVQEIEQNTHLAAQGADAPAEKRPRFAIGNYEDVEIKPIDFLFFPWFPRGYITEIQGDSGSSKSTFMYAVGAKVSTGSDLMGSPCEAPGNVMFITNEDDAGDIKVSFQDAGGDLSKLKRIIEREDIARLNLSPEGAKMLDKIIKEADIKLLVLDPIQQFLTGDMNKASETRPQMARLMNIAAENNICITFTAHTGKDTTKAALHRGIGSVDIGASTRSILQVVTDPEDDFYKIMFTVKSNLAAYQDVQRAIRYRVKDHPGSYDPETKKRARFRGHAEFTDLLPEYNERLYKKAMRKADEAEEEETALAFEYDADPLTLTARELVAENPNGLFIGTDDLIQKITTVCGRCPYDQTKNKSTGIYARAERLRNLLLDNDGIQMDKQSNSVYPKAYNWRGELVEPEHNRTRGFTLTAVRARKPGSQQTKI